MTRAPHSRQDPPPQRPDPGAPGAPRPTPPRRPAEPAVLVPDYSRIEQIQDMALEERAPALTALREDLAAALHQAQDGAGTHRPHGSTPSGPRG